MSNVSKPVNSSCGCDSGNCAPSGSPTLAPSPDDIRTRVREGYSTIAREGQWSGVTAVPVSSGCCGPNSANTSSKSGRSGGGCCGPATISTDDIARAVGYSDSDLVAIPGGANLGLSCGNPAALAALKVGEAVLDLGSGGGFDCFIAGTRVGATGQVIGVDMTPDMLTRARRNIATYRERSGLDNVQFRLGEIEHIPVADSSIDVVMSNCVLNLSPDKPRVWREIARVLKPGGRVAISDLALLKPLPDEVKHDVEALVGCIAGAVLIHEMDQMAIDAGLVNVSSQRKPGYVDAMVNSADPLYVALLDRLPKGSRVADYVASVEFTARRPA